MKSAGWKDIAELVGIAAIVASLIFVGLQTRQSHEIALAAQYQSRAELSLNLLATHIEVGYVIPPLRDKITDTFTARDIAQAQWQWIAIDNHYFQYQKGFLEEDAWQGQVRTAQQLYENCGSRFVWETRKRSLRSELVAVVESWDDNC